MAVTMTTNVQEAAEPYTRQFTSNDTVGPESQTFEHTFTATADGPTGKLVFQFGGGAEDLTFCVDDVSPTDSGGSGETGATTGGDTAGGGDATGATAFGGAQDRQ